MDKSHTYLNLSKRNATKKEFKSAKQKINNVANAKMRSPQPDRINTNITHPARQYTNSVSIRFAPNNITKE